MSSSPESGSNKVVYIVAGVVLLGLVSLCCALGIVGAAWGMYAGTSPDMEVRNDWRGEGVDPYGDRALEPSGPVSLLPPPSLRVIPRRTADRRRRHIEATVTSAAGSSGVSVGDNCSFDVEVLSRGGAPGHWCRTFVECSGVRLFGQDVPHRTGFFPCELYDMPLGVAGEDLTPTVDAMSGDPMLQIDTRANRLFVADNERGPRSTAYRVVARIDSVTAR